MWEKASLIARAAAYMLPLIWHELGRGLKAMSIRQRARWFGSTPATERDQTIVIVGASFAGYYVARYLALGLPPHSRYRVVVVEPNSHFQFSWVLPRYCVAPGHEHKAFVPYGGHIRGAPEGAVRWIQDRVAEATKGFVRLEGSGEEIPYNYLVIATGSGVKHGLPSRVNDTEKLGGMGRLQAMQKGIKAAKKIVVVGGGAAGVELATDAKDLYPEKHVVLVHSRSALMHRFGSRLQDEALSAMEAMGAEVILNERVVHEDAEAGTVTLRSGRVIECDLFINCTGQKPSSEAFVSLSPNAIATTGHVKVKPTLQIADDTLPNVYVCGDIADTHAPNTNSFSAVRQAMCAADNILLALEGGQPRHTFEPFWMDGVIKLTLGLHRSVFHMGDGTRQFQSESKVKEELMAADAWRQLGEKTYEDHAMENGTKTAVSA